MDIGYIQKVLEKAENISDSKYYAASMGSRQELSYMYARTIFEILLEAIKEVEPPKNKK